jgi:hypothetical protein
MFIVIDLPDFLKPRRGDIYLLGRHTSGQHSRNKKSERSKAPFGAAHFLSAAPTELASFCWVEPL